MAKFACVRGSDWVDCGPAALATVARHHGLHLSVANIRETAGTDTQGTDTAQLRTAAERLGFMASAGRAKDGALDAIPLPAIAHFVDPPRGHFVVVHKVEPGVVVVADPARGVLRMPRAEFMRRWSRNVVLLAPAAEFRPNAGDAGPLRRILRLALAERRLLAQSVVCAAVVALLGFGMSFFLKAVLDRVIPRSDLGLLHALALGVLAALALRALCDMVRQYLLAHVGLRIELSLGREYVRHLISLPVRFFDSRALGDLSSRLGDATSVRAGITGAVLSVFIDVLLLAGAILLMFVYNASLTLISLALLPVVAGVTLALQRPLVRFQREIRELYSQVYNRFIETIGNIRIIKVFSAEEAACGRVEEPFARMQAVQLRRDLVAGLLGVCSTFLTTGVSVVLLWVGAGAIVQGRLTVGELMLFSSMLGFLLSPVQGLTLSVATLRQAGVAMERLVEIESVEPEGKADGEKRRPETLRGEIEFKDASFAYRQGYPVLTDVSLRILPGQTTAIMGETGSGKTSMANLMTAFYVVSEGSVLIDGVDVQQYDRRALRKHIGIVFQDPSLVSGTVRENVVLGDPQASTARVERAARLAGAHDFILALPKQYDYEVGDRGVALSSGQRQRIAIARALLREPAILILDEATSNLDVETERQVMESILASRAGKTTIVITHRLQNVRRAQEIVVLERGRIIERGGHAQLLRLGGKYRALWSTLVSGDSDS